MPAAAQHPARAGVSGGAHRAAGVDGVEDPQAQRAEPPVMDAGTVNRSKNRSHTPMPFSIVTALNPALSTTPQNRPRTPPGMTPRPVRSATLPPPR